jgi:hypothetical protein
MNMDCNPFVRPDSVDKPFPPAPMSASARLRPLDSWQSIYREAQVTGIEFDAFWYEAAADGICYFFSWLGEPRSTVLVILDEERVTHVECRKVGDLLMTDAETAPILAELADSFACLATTGPASLN